jgi:hypothetical protein
LAVAACGGALALGAGVANAGIATGIEKDGSGHSGSSLENTWIVGHLTSSNEKCIPGRNVKVLFHYITEGQPKLVDSGRSNSSGAFAGYGPTARDELEVDAFVVRVASKNIGTKKHPKICASFEDEFSAF